MLTRLFAALVLIVGLVCPVLAGTPAGNTITAMIFVGTDWTHRCIKMQVNNGTTWYVVDAAASYNNGSFDSLADVLMSAFLSKTPIGWQGLSADSSCGSYTEVKNVWVGTIN